MGKRCPDFPSRTCFTRTHDLPTTISAHRQWRRRQLCSKDRIAGVICPVPFHLRVRVKRPSSGSVRVSFTGTVKFEDGETYSNYRLWIPFLEGSTSSNDDLLGDANCFPTPTLCDKGGSGELLWFFVYPDSGVGKYGYQIGSSTEASFSIFARNATGSEVESRQVFSIEVVEGVVPLPAAA